MNELKLCGYKLAARGLRVEWAALPYEGYDREYFYEMNFLADIFRDDGTELWKLQSAAMDKDMYCESLDDLIVLWRGFQRHGKQLDVLRVRVDVAHCIVEEDMKFLPDARPAPDSAFAFLGYDVGWLLGKHSIIHQPGFMDVADEAVRSSWAARLNKHGLLRTIDDALEFRRLFYAQPDRESGDYEILEVALWRGEPSGPDAEEEGKSAS